MINMSMIYQRFNLPITIILSAMQVSILLDLVFANFILLKLMGSISPYNLKIIIVLVILVVCLLSSLVFVKKLSIKVLILCLTLINIIWYIYVLYESLIIGPLPLV